SYRASGATSLPAYLLQLVPMIAVDGAMVAKGSSVGMGQDQVWDVSIDGPMPAMGEHNVYRAAAGSELVFGVNGNGLTSEVVKARLDAVPSGSAAESLHQVALNYWAQVELFDSIAAAAHGVYKQRLPSVGAFASPLSVDM